MFNVSQLNDIMKLYGSHQVKRRKTKTLKSTFENIQMRNNKETQICFSTICILDIHPSENYT